MNAQCIAVFSGKGVLRPAFTAPYGFFGGEAADREVMGGSHQQLFERRRDKNYAAS